MPRTRSSRSYALSKALNRSTSATSRWKRAYRINPSTTDGVVLAAVRGLDSQRAGPTRSVPTLLRTSTRGVVHGRGVVASVDIPANVPIIMGTGTIRELDVHLDGAYIYSMKGAGTEFAGLDFDMEGSRGSRPNIVMYINTCWGTGLQANCVVLWRSCMPFVYSMKPIKAGSELLVDYTM